MNNGENLTDRISRAKNVIEVNALLEKGKQFRNATQRTKNRWQIAAKNRIVELKDEIPM